ncbi:TetR/AcrR family transcriptional regulator [Alkalibacillus aidingensis]|uniref:TetR/AcrR family transcriptional regulator n=1 Tax=Alkalibacillus aidingensis TaxID=2747607 RepID=UPI00166108E1|nr:TetR/AcrR family transcriptional regulator [Alkalibacillus aidingensis]
MSISEEKRLTKKGEITRFKLLQTAERVFGENGYFESSVVDITQEAGVAQGTFYNYFPSKKSIYDELVYQMSSQLRRYIKERISGTETFEEAQREGFLAFFEWVQNHRNLYSIIQQAVLVDLSLYEWYYEKLASGFIKAINQAIDSGEIKSLDPETMAYCFMGIGQFLGMRWIYWNQKPVPEDKFEAAMSFIFGNIKRSG